MIYSINAPTKVNLTLYITHVTQSGLHHLQSIVGFYDLFDTIYIKESNETKFSYNAFVEIDENFKSKNGIITAYRWLSSKYKIPNIEINLEKHIPIKAGLGGGSSDIAAFVYKMCELYEIDPLIIKESISEFGADVLVCFLYHLEKHPLFFIDGTGKEGVSLIKDIPNYLFNPTVLINQGIQLETKEVFNGFDNFKPHPKNIEHAIIFGENVLIKNALKIAPGLKNLFDLGPMIKMSGSGSTCFLITKDDVKIDMWHKWVKLFKNLS